MSRRTLSLAVLALALPSLAVAQESYRHGRVRHAESGVSLQRATEPGAEEAVANMPFLPGDRVWSDASGRAEFQFADGAILRLGHGSKLDYVAHEEGDGARVILRLWSGSLTLHPVEGRGAAELVVETPGGALVPQRRGVYRVDVDSGEMRVSVYEGEAVLEADRRLTVRAGERAYARGGEVYGEPETFDRAEIDDFGRWDADRYAETRVAQEDVPEYLPEDISPYAGELRDHGSWLFEANVGHVWRPYVDAGWRPYHNGRWIWTSYGWTWLPYERWGWAPFHYGRWDHAPALGWYWVPGRAWSPAWVDWAVGGDYVGWCPSGWRGRRMPAGRAQDGWAVPRGRDANAWLYARRGDLGARDLSRRVAFDTALPRNMTLLEPHAVVTRDVRVGTAPVAAAAPRAVPRSARTRPRPADATPEMRADPLAATPLPAARRRQDGEREREGAERAATRRGRPAPQDAAAAPADDAASAPPPAATPPTLQPAPAPVIARPFPWSARPRPAPTERAAETPSPEADRDVLRPVFRPLSRPRPDAAERGRGADSGARPAPQAEPAAPRAARPERRPEPSAPRAEPSTPRPERSAPRAEPRPEPAPAGASSAGGDRATRRKRDN